MTPDVPFHGHFSILRNILSHSYYLMLLDFFYLVLNFCEIFQIHFASLVDLWFFFCVCVILFFCGQCTTVQLTPVLIQDNVQEVSLTGLPVSLHDLWKP